MDPVTGAANARDQPRLREAESRLRVQCQSLGKSRSRSSRAAELQQESGEAGARWFRLSSGRGTRRPPGPKGKMRRQAKPGSRPRISDSSTKPECISEAEVGQPPVSLAIELEHVDTQSGWGPDVRASARVHRGRGCALTPEVLAPADHDRHGRPQNERSREAGAQATQTKKQETPARGVR
jgi:hypothetical protein